MTKYKKSIASKPCSNWGGIEIMDINDDRVIVRDNYGKPTKAHHSKVRYNANGDPYFKHNGRREYLRDYIRHW
jgi:hypothetical protein